MQLSPNAFSHLGLIFISLSVVDILLICYFNGLRQVLVIGARAIMNYFFIPGGAWPN